MLTGQRYARQADRTPEIVGTALAANPRRYLGNNPTNATDPSGLETPTAGGYRQFREWRQRENVMTEGKALDILIKQRDEWVDKGWQFPVALLNHFIEKKGPQPYTPTGCDINEAARESTDLIKKILRDQVDEYVGIIKVGSTFT